MNIRKATIYLAVLTLVGSLFVAPSVAANNYDYESDAMPNPRIDANVTKASHNMSWMDIMDYENDNGNDDVLDAVLNETYDNPFDYRADKIYDDSFDEFPRKDDEDGDNEASILDASEWSKSGQNSSKLSISDTQTADNVDAVSIATDGNMGTDDKATGEYTNFSTILDSDEDKRYIQLILNVNTLDSSTHVNISVVDEDGDYKNVSIDSSDSESGSSVVANSTGNGYIFQEKLGDISLNTGSGSDGSFDNIESFKVNITDADADLTFSAIDLERMGEWDFGTKLEDTDGDDELEDKEINETSGTIHIKSLDTLGSTFNDAVLNDLGFPAQFRAQDLDANMDVSTSFSNASNYPSFERMGEFYHRLQLPSQIDLSYSNAELVDHTKLPGDRYTLVEYSEGVGDTEFSDISSWTDKTSDYSSLDKNISLDGTIQAGQQYAIHQKILLTQQEEDSITIESSGNGSAGGPAPKEGGGGPIDMLFSFPGMVISGILGFLGLKRLVGKSGSGS